MATIKETIEKLVTLKHKLAVWEALHAHLEEFFISKDGRAAQKAIKVNDCAVAIVPEDTIEDILQGIGDGPIKELRSEVEDIETQQVVILGEAKGQA